MRVLEGIAAADGIAIGEAFILERGERAITRQQLRKSDIPVECARFRRSRVRADRRLHALQKKLATVGRDTAILEAHRVMVNDPYLADRVVALIESEQVNAAWALEKVAEEIRSNFAQVEDGYLRERQDDVRFLLRELLRGLQVRPQPPADPPRGAIVVAHSLSPADIAHLHRLGVGGLAVDTGGPTCHTAIMARSLGIPAVVGLQRVTHHALAGARTILDGNRGLLVVAPAPRTLADYRRRRAARGRLSRRLREQSTLPCQTRDGVTVRVMANIELPEEIPATLTQGCDGIGLFRTEFLYLGRNDLPSEDEHFAHAKKVLRACGRLPVTFRTSDLGEDKLPFFGAAAKASNPAMGLRAIRLCLKHEALFRPQLRGLLRAARLGKMRIMFPMISGVEELRRAKAILSECADEVAAGNAAPQVAVGMMLELPSAALAVDLLAQEVDFFAIGTNDLIQYLLGIDRSSEQVTYLYRPLHPALLRLLRHVVHAAQRHRVPVSVCGEMAATPALAMVLLGLGISELSMSASAIPAVKSLVRQIRCTDAEALSERLLTLDTPEEMEAEVRQTVRTLMPETSADPWP